MNEDIRSPQTSAPEAASSAAEPQDAAALANSAMSGELDSIDNLDFLLEEIENKIAPLALA